MLLLNCNLHLGSHAPYKCWGAYIVIMLHTNVVVPIGTIICESVICEHLLGIN